MVSQSVAPLMSVSASARAPLCCLSYGFIRLLLVLFLRRLSGSCFETIGSPQRLLRLRFVNPLAVCEAAYPAALLRICGRIALASSWSNLIF
jgi:hypothetical protein